MSALGPNDPTGLSQLDPSGRVEVTPGVGPTQSLPAGSSALANGATQDNGTPRATHTALVTWSAGVTAGVVTLEVSHDNANWFNAGTANFAASTVNAIVYAGAARYVRAAITTAVVGGTVGATIASA